MRLQLNICHVHVHVHVHANALTHFDFANHRQLHFYHQHLSDIINYLRLT